MATCLRCDYCGSVADERDEALRTWWSLERYGMSWVQEPGKGGHVHIPAMIMSTLMLDDGLMDEDEELEMEPHVEFLDVDAGADDITLHFCKAACIGAWAQEAAVFDA